MLFLIFFAKQIFLYAIIMPVIIVLAILMDSVPVEPFPHEVVLIRVSALAASLCEAVEQKRIPTNANLGRQFGFRKFPGELAQRLRVYPAFTQGCDFHVIVYGDRGGIRISGRNRNDYILTFTVGIYGSGAFDNGWLDSYEEPDTFYVAAVHIDPLTIKVNGRNCPNPFVPDAYGMASKPPSGCSHYWNWPKELIDPGQVSGAAPK